LLLPACQVMRWALSGAARWKRARRLVSPLHARTARAEDHQHTNNQCETESGNSENATVHMSILRERRFN
jgi:hypothetical protein